MLFVPDCILADGKETKNGTARNKAVARIVKVVREYELNFIIAILLPYFGQTAPGRKIRINPAPYTERSLLLT